MAKGAYIGVDGVARKVNKIYVGVEGDIPIYDETTEAVTITADNISDYFTVTNSTYYFAGSDTIFTANNLGINSKTATTTLKALKDMDNLSLKYGYTSESNYDKFTFKVGSTTIESAVSGTLAEKEYTGSLKTGDTLTFSYSKDSSQHASGETCWFGDISFSNTTITQTGTVTKSVARRVKKGYVGIGGVARPCFGLNPLVYYGTIEELSVARYYLAATTVGDYALFGGGSSSDYSSTVDAYNTSLTRSIPTALSVGRTELAATSVGDYALFGGGLQTNLIGSTPNKNSSTVDAYNTSLTRSTPTALSVGRSFLTATTVGDYALFGGGAVDNNGSSTVDAYNTSLTRSTPTALSVGRTYLAATTVGDYALFGGGADNYSPTTYYSTVDAYNTSLTRSIPTELSNTTEHLAATTVGDYALFGGGYVLSTKRSVVNAYNTSLTRSIPTALSVARYYLAATTVGDYALFGGGSSSDYSSTVDAYNTSLTRSIPTALSVGRTELAATSVGDYALFGGGDIGNYLSVVDAYKFNADA